MKNDLNLENTYYDNIDSNFINAYNLSESEFTHIELINMLKTGNIPQKQIAAIKLDCIHNTEEIEVLLSNLTGCDGKIREAVAQKIYTLITNNDNIESFANLSPDIFADATIDINANICRLIVDSARMLKNYEKFSLIYTNKLISYAKDALCELDKFIFRDKKYVINKQLFKLYWCLEGLRYFYNYANPDDLKFVLYSCSTIDEYTIREKIAQIIIQTDNFNEIKQKLKNDNNYYVRQIFKSS